MTHLPIAALIARDATEQHLVAERRRRRLPRRLRFA
jgi:hypothetical protein